MSEQEKRGNQETDPVQEALRRIEKKSDITLIIAILILVVGLGTATAIAPQAIAVLLMAIFVLVATIVVVGLFIHLVFKALRGRRSEEEPKEGIHSKP